MNKQKIIKKAEQYIKKHYYNESTGHDWYHIQRVRTIAKRIAEQEKADLFIVELGSLFHDLDDYKFSKQYNTVPQAKKILKQLKVDSETNKLVLDIVKNCSFKGAGVKDKMKTIEGKAVQDADRLDAIGAIGIARAITIGQKFNRPIYDPNIKPVLHKSFKDFRKKNGTTINHFYEKLLLIKDRMHTKTGKAMAKQRYRFMKKYLEQFFNEWQGKS